MKITDFFRIFGTKEKVVYKEAEKEVTKGLIGIGADIFNPSDSLVNTKTVSNKLIKANTGWVYANVSTIARSVSQIEFCLYATRMVGGEIEYNEIEDHPLLDVLDRFNSMISQTDGFYLTQSYMELAGDCFWLIDGVGRNIKNIYVLQPDKVTVNFDNTTQGVQIKSYTYKDNVDGKAIEITYTPEEIIHFKVPDPGNQVRGKSVVAGSATIIDTDNMAEEYNKNLFMRGAIQNFILSTEKNIDETEMKRLEMKLQKNYGGVANAHKTMILSGGLKPDRISDTNRDMEFSLQQQWARDKIAAMFGNNKAVLGITEDVNRANADATIDQWLKQTIKPKMKRIVDTLNEFLVPQFGTGIILGFEDPAPENRMDKVAEAQNLYGSTQKPIISLNEARELVGLDSTGNPDDDIVPSSQDNPNQQLQMPTEDPNQEQNVPKAVANVNYKQVLRRNGMYKKVQAYKLDKQFKSSAKTIAKNLIKPKKSPAPKQDPVRRGSEHYTQAELLAFWKKMDYISRSKEKAFKEQVIRFLEQIEMKVMAVVQTIETKGLAKAAAQDLFSIDEEVSSGIDLFKPLTLEIANLAGQEAYRLVKYFKQYKPSLTAQDIINQQTDKFIKSILITDKERLTKILIEGISNGDSTDQISRRLRDTFVDIKKYQSDKVARTETLRTANMAADDAYNQSGVVEAKEWLTAGDPCPICEPYDGQVIELGGNFFEDNFSEGDPPLHVNCRCTIIPVLSSNDKGMNDETEELKEYVKELESLLELDNE